MEARLGGGSHHFVDAGSSKGLVKKPQEWDLNDWKWDGELFVASPIHPGPVECGKKKLLPDIVPSNSTSSCSVEVEFGTARKVLGEADKRRRIVVEEEDEHCYEAGPLTLMLGGYANPVIVGGDHDCGENKTDKGSMMLASSANYPKCQVEGCGTDLSQYKEYHRRHKVCEMHAKTSSALVGNVLQRFCQQCSRFHLLQEFDEGKRSCRRRLVGHNKRRRKTNSNAPPSGTLDVGDQTTSYLLISLLKILTNLTSGRTEQSEGQETLANILKNIVSLCGSSDGNNSSGVQASQDLRMVGASSGTPRKAAVAPISGAPNMEENVNTLCSPARTISATPMASNCCVAFNVAASELRCQKNYLGSTYSEAMQHSGRPVSEDGLPAKLEASRLWKHMLPAARTADGSKTKRFDLNTVYDGEQDVVRSQLPTNPATLHMASSNCAPCMLEDFHQRSPPQTSGIMNSSTRSPSSSNGDAQNHTDRIVFKLFGKGPNDFPLVLRAQIFNWLSHSPTDMESYIRPGCIILTLYLCLAVSAWDELCCDLDSSLRKLLSLTADDFWRVGWIYARVQHHIAVIYNGQIMLNKSLIRGGNGCRRIFSVTPIAVPPASQITFIVKGSNLVGSATRIHCAFDGKYLALEINQMSLGCSDNRSHHEQFQSLGCSCFLPDAIGRGFIEVEENDLSSGFFPFIVAEEDVCAELRMLESSIDVASCDALLEDKVEAARSLCVSFLHEMGWLLRRCQLRNRSELKNSSLEAFSLIRFRWILRFAIDRDWTAIVKRLLDILFEENIETGLCPTEVALSECPLHYAVQSNSKSTVKLLLSYKPKNKPDRDIEYLFRPDMLGPSGRSPLHIAAASTHSDGMLNLLTEDPGQFGLEAWRNARDSSGFTPEDYARVGGHESYIILMHKKINKRTEKVDVVVNIPAKLSLVSDATHKQAEILKYDKLGLEIENNKLKLSQPAFCKLCEKHLVCRSNLGRPFLYRPILLSMVGIAAVCVCVGLLWKSPPEVDFVYQPFRWELLGCGFI